MSSLSSVLPQQAPAAAGPWVPLLPALGWQLQLLWLPAQLQRAPPALPDALHAVGLVCLVSLALSCGLGGLGGLSCLLYLSALGALGWECWAWGQGQLAAQLPGCMGVVGACMGPLPGTTSGPALAGHAAGSRLGAAGGGPPGGTQSAGLGWGLFTAELTQLVRCSSTRTTLPGSLSASLRLLGLPRTMQTHGRLRQQPQGQVSQLGGHKPK
ncbi:hypothetical protein HaLaN_20108 [Haematococcus lacustris]|uniref:Uncharacterized protein n=1 Tax=Haematococcus lacustris TaxID=44745 RepID=A0A699ZVC0_HAELA|nr:hypothetical protein HaLaN_20108 [Haematococcus lacustris]